MPFARELRTSRLVLRPWGLDEAARLKAAIDANLAHLQAWMPWAMDEPSPEAAIAERLARFAHDFEADADSVYAILARDDGRVLGGTGLHPRIEGGVEIGYWLDWRETGRGCATEAAAALTAEAFRRAAVARVQVRCDPRNAASARVPARLGFRHVATLPADTTTPAGAPRDTMVWELARAAWPALAPAWPARIALRIRSVEDAADVETVRALLREYQAAIGADLTYQAFDEEVAGLPGRYAPPGGRLLLAEDEAGAVGCVALRALDAARAEMKRLFVRPRARGTGAGQALVEALVRTARAAGYAELVLDTLPMMHDAQRLYARLGFTPTAPYYAGAADGTRFMACALGPG